jgi:N-acetylmuramoyl-L-alanine amidase
MYHLRLILFLFIVPLYGFGQDLLIVIDPGHGGTDPGHLSVKASHLQEKDINLILAKKIGHYLETKLHHVKIKYTRTDDSFPSLEERTSFANNANADYFISIHCNGTDLTSTKGTETHVHDATSVTAIEWATMIEHDFKHKAGRTSRGVKTDDDRGHSLEVLKYTTMTSVLVECGFMSNVKEANYLNTTHGQDILASAIYRATKKFLIKQHPKISFTKKERKKNVVVEKVKPTENNSKTIVPTYKIRLMSSGNEIATTDKVFKVLNDKVTCIKLETGKYRYIYTIGPYNDLESCQKALDSARKNGFSDAYLIKIDK